MSESCSTPEGRSPESKRPSPAFEWLRFSGITLLAAGSVFIAYGKPLEISGICAPLVWILPLLPAAHLIFRYYQKKRLKQGILIFCTVLYLMATGLHLLQDSVRTVVSDFQSERCAYVTYEVNPGAMSSISFEQRTYYLLLDTEFLTIRYLLASRNHGYLG